MMAVINFRSIFSAFLFLILFGSFEYCIAETQNDCLKDSMCIRSEQGATEIVFFVKNFKGFDQTVTFDFPMLENLSTESRVPVTLVCPARSEIPVARLSHGKGVAWNYSYKYWVSRGGNNVRHDDSYLYRLPFRSGDSFEVVQGFNGSFSHKDENIYAVDFALPTGTTVFAAREGKVVDVYVDSDISGPSKEYVEYGNYVIIEHSDKTLGEYWHLKKKGALVRVGEIVQAGSPIAISGNTGFSSGPHLHFAVTSSVDGKTLKSHKIRFKSREGIIDFPVEGKKYTAE